MSDQILARLETCWNLGIPNVFLIEEILGCPIGVVATLVYFEPNLSNTAGKGTAIGIAFGHICEYGTLVRKTVPME